MMGGCGEVEEEEEKEGRRRMLRRGLCLGCVVEGSEGVGA